MGDLAFTQKVELKNFAQQVHQQDKKKLSRTKCPTAGQDVPQQDVLLTAGPVASLKGHQRLRIPACIR